MKSFSAASTILLISVATLQAAPPGKKDQDRPKVDASGEIKEVGRGYIRMMTKEGDQWTVKVDDPKAKVRYSGTATADFLKPGMAVELVAQFTKQGQPAGTVKKVRVFSPTKKDKPSIEREAGLSTKDLFTLDKDKDKEKPKEDLETYKIKGAIRAERGGKLLISAGNQMVRVVVDPKATVSLDLATYKLAQHGDRVTIKGWASEPTKAVATQVLITGDDTIGAKKK